MPPRRTPPSPDEASAGGSESPATTNGPNLQFISSEIACVPKIDISTCTPDRFQIWKQQWNSAMNHQGLLWNTQSVATVVQRQQ